jgi:CelD/BcsL family acetyltransferase involved in cellulose biosynthesis
VEVRAVESLGEFRALGPEFLALERRMPGLSPYTTHAWMTAFWSAFSGETTCRAICVFADGRLAAWLPLTWPKGLRRLLPPRVARPLGGRWGILSVACDPTRPEALGCLVRALQSRALPGWDGMVLGPFGGDPAAVRRLREALLVERLPFAERVGSNPFVRLDGSWEAFVGRQSQNFRRTMRKRLERADADGSLRIRHEAAPSAERLRETAVAVSRRSWQGAAGVAVSSSAGGRAFYAGLRDPGESFEVHLTTVEREGACIAYLVGTVRSGTYHQFDTGFLPEHGELCPGLVVHFALLRELCRRGVRELDFGFEAAYKERFAPEYRTWHDFRVFSGNAPRLLWKLTRLARGES